MQERSPAPERLPAQEWRAREAAHESAVDARVAGHEQRRRAGQGHPVEDFLFVYYNFPPARLRRWHPGPGIVLEEAGATQRAGWAHYAADAAGAVRLDVAGFLERRGSTVNFVRDLLVATRGRSAYTGCFGMHEWAMVYRQAADQVRHSAYPLRLGPAGTDEVVEAHQIRCSHFDAFRFFTDAARPRNAIQPDRASQVALEQPGCLHAGMDLYKWAHKLSPLTPSDLVLEAFDLAREIRTLDMRASPYDLSELGYRPVPVETPEGKAEYAAAQRAFAARGNALRDRLLALLPQCGEPPGRPDRTGVRAEG